MIEVFVSRLGRDSSSNSYVVVLQEKNGERLLPIWIGQPEAESIVLHMHNVKRTRPLTHDLVRNLILGMGAQLRRVNITRVEDRTYFAELLIQLGDAVVQVDARPSDSIAIALRLDSPIIQRGVGREIQLTDGIAALLAQQPVFAYEFEGTRYDCGSKLGYLKATVALGMKHPEIGKAFAKFLGHKS